MRPNARPSQVRCESNVRHQDSNKTCLSSMINNRHVVLERLAAVCGVRSEPSSFSLYGRPEPSRLSIDRGMYNNGTETKLAELEQTTWVWVTSVRGCHQNWRACLARARSGLPVVIRHGRDDAAEPVGLVDWRLIVLLEKLHLLPLKQCRLPISDRDLERLRQAHDVLYNVSSMRHEP